MAGNKKYKLHKKVHYDERVSEPTPVQQAQVEPDLVQPTSVQPLAESIVTEEPIVEESQVQPHESEETQVEPDLVQPLNQSEETLPEPTEGKLSLFKKLTNKFLSKGKNVVKTEAESEAEPQVVQEETVEEVKQESNIKKAVISVIKKNNLNKLGQFKLVFDVANINDLVHLSLKCFDIDFTGFKVKSVETLYNKTVNLKSETYESDVYLMISDIKEILKVREINKPICILNYISNLMFFETMTIPKLSAVESNKSIQMNLVKAYPEFQKKYVYDILKFSSTNHSNTYRVAMVEIERYRKVLNWFKELKLNLTDVSLSFDSVRRYVSKSSQLSKKHTALIINMKENHTVISSFDSKKIEGLRIAVEGYSNLIKGVCNHLEIKEAKLKKMLEEGKTLDELVSKRDQRTVLRRSLPEVLLEMKRVIGEVLLTHKIDDIYLNVEGFEGEFLSNAISKYFKVNVRNFVFTSPDINNNLSSYGALLKVNKAFDFNYPNKLRN